MFKLKSIDKQIEDMATKWYIKEHYSDRLKDMDENTRKEYVNRLKAMFNMPSIVGRYLKEHPEKKKEYIAKKRRINKIRTLIGLGAITLAVGSGVKYHFNHLEPQKSAIEFEHVYDENEMQDMELKDFFESIEKTKNEGKRNEKITNFTKEVIVEKYNKEHAGEELTAERLEYYNLDENVLVNVDKFGNTVSYERVSQKEQIETNDNQGYGKLSGGIYEFKIDGKTVAVYDENGQEVQDKNIEEKQDFKDALPVVQEAAKLKEIFKYNNPESYIRDEERTYKSVVKDYSNGKLAMQNDKELEQIKE